MCLVPICGLLLDQFLQKLHTVREVTLTQKGTFRFHPVMFLMLLRPPGLCGSCGDSLALSSKMFQNVLTYSNPQLWISYEQLLSTKSTFLKDLLGSSVADGRDGRLAACSLTSSRTGHSPAVQRQGATGVGGGRIILLRLWQQQQGLAEHGDVSKHLMARKWRCRMDSNGVFSLWMWRCKIWGSHQNLGIGNASRPSTLVQKSAFQELLGPVRSVSFEL